MTLDRRPRRLPRPLVFPILAGASLLVAHDAVFLVQLGPGEPLARVLRGGGHAYWQAASTILAGVATLAALAVVYRLAILRRQALRLSPTGAPPPVAGRRRIALRIWVRLLAVVAVGFTIQENVEHALGHDHLIGLAALHGPEYPLALPVLAAVTALASMVAAAVLGVERALLAAIVAALARRPRAARGALRRPARVALRRPSPLAASQAGRAPPTLLVGSPTT